MVRAKASPPRISDYKADITTTVASRKPFLLLWSGIALIPKYSTNPPIVCRNKIFQWLNDTQLFLESVIYFSYIC